MIYIDNVNNICSCDKCKRTGVLAYLRTGVAEGEDSNYAHLERERSNLMD